MESRALPSFRKVLADLPGDVQELASVAFGRWKKNPRHPSLHFKKVSSSTPIYSVRIGSHYRALGRLKDSVMYWFWIGSHAAYDQMLKRLQ